MDSDVRTTGADDVLYLTETEPFTSAYLSRTSRMTTVKLTGEARGNAFYVESMETVEDDQRMSESDGVHLRKTKSGTIDVTDEDDAETREEYRKSNSSVYSVFLSTISLQINLGDVVRTESGQIVTKLFFENRYLPKVPLRKAVSMRIKIEGVPSS